MKYLAVVLFLPALALAQTQQAQPQAPSFEEFKQFMQPALAQSLPLMKETRDCLEKAATKETTEQCIIDNAKKVIALQQKLGGSAAPPPQDPEKIGRFPEGFEWNQEVKQQMLEKMDRAINFNTVQQECLGHSNSKEEMDECMRSKLSAQPKP